jgi:hypothetical protein
METTNVTDEIRSAAKSWADQYRHVRYSKPWKEIYDSFIAGSAYNKPIEHNQQPINGEHNGKESKDYANNI